jgi:hypothetical protein
LDHDSGDGRLRRVERPPRFFGRVQLYLVKRPRERAPARRFGLLHRAAERMARRVYIPRHEEAHRLGGELFWELCDHFLSGGAVQPKLILPHHGAPTSVRSPERRLGSLSLPSCAYRGASTER